MPKIPDAKLVTYASDISSHNLTVKAELKVLLDDILAKSTLALDSANSLIAFNDAEIQRIKDMVASVNGMVQGSYYSLSMQIAAPQTE